MLEISREDRWLAIGAAEKARSVLDLVTEPVARVLEVGAGSGSLLRELDRAGFGEEYWACEPSVELHEQLVQKDIERLVSAYATTLEDSPLLHRAFDLAILSHVLEHVIAPAALLARCLDVAPLVLAEVPLDANLAGRIRASVMRRPRWPNPAGHVHFFSRRSAHDLVGYAGGEVLRTRSYFPLAAYEYHARDPMRKAIVRGARVSPALGRAYHAHLALLIGRREVNISEAHDLYFDPRRLESRCSSPRC